MRMTEKSYSEILELVSPLITRKYMDTNMRKAINPHEWLSATLRYLANGQPPNSKAFALRYDHVDKHYNYDTRIMQSYL